MTSCAPNQFCRSSIESRGYGKTPDNRAVDIYTLQNSMGMQARIATYGGTVTSLTAPDRHGRFADVVLGFDSLSGYLASESYIGALIGRYGNRIAGGRFSLDGVEHVLVTNDGPNTLHGGVCGLDKVIWTATAAAATPGGARLTLTHTSPAGEQGFPGELRVTAVYTLADDNALMLELGATTDRDTVVNLTQHSYFNLRGSGDILSTLVKINAEEFTAVDAELIPTGQIHPVAGTPFDFRAATPIGARIREDDPQLRHGSGYDHNFIISKPAGRFGPVATAYDAHTGRILEISSTEPGLQFYSGNFLGGGGVGKGGRVYTPRCGFCMEPQHYPDSPNHEGFPSTVLRSSQSYSSRTVYRFRTDEDLAGKNKPASASPPDR